MDRFARGFWQLVDNDLGAVRAGDGLTVRRLSELRSGEDSLLFGTWRGFFFASAALHSLSSLITIGPMCKESLIEIPKDATGKDSGGLVLR